MIIQLLVEVNRRTATNSACRDDIFGILNWIIACRTTITFLAAKFQSAKITNAQMRARHAGHFDRKLRATRTRLLAWQNCWLAKIEAADATIKVGHYRGFRVGD